MIAVARLTLCVIGQTTLYKKHMAAWQRALAESSHAVILADLAAACLSSTLPPLMPRTVVESLPPRATWGERYEFLCTCAYILNTTPGPVAMMLRLREANVLGARMRFTAPPCLRAGVYDVRPDKESTAAVYRFERL